jgi:hypothetical protein
MCLGTNPVRGRSEEEMWNHGTYNHIRRVVIKEGVELADLILVQQSMGTTGELSFPVGGTTTAGP